MFGFGLRLGYVIGELLKIIRAGDYLLDESGNFLTDESGINRLTG